MKYTARLVFVLYLLSCFWVLAQEKKAKDLPDAQQIKVLKAQGALKDAQQAMSNLQSQWSQLQLQIKEIEKQAPGIAQRVNDSQKAKAEAVDEAAKAIGLDPKQYDFDDAKLTFNPKASPAPATPSPEKK